MSLVLVADDEPAVLDALSGVVEDLGHDVLQAHDGREALEIARRRMPNLVVTDHMMPHLSGLDLCRQLKHDDRLRDVPVILLSGATPHGTPDAAAFLPKPFELSDFERLVTETLATQQPRSGEPAEDEADVPSVMLWAAHELRTPLSAARIQVHLLEKALASGDPKKPLNALRRQLFSLEHMASVLADEAELRAGSLRLRQEPLDLLQLVRSTLEGWQARCAEFRFEARLPDGPVRVEADPIRLTRVLDVLLGNAVKHGAADKRIEVWVEVAATHAAVHVTDHGRGVAAGDRDGLFRGFHRRAEHRPAGGLELHVASELARAHGGGVTVKSQPGAGATFTLSLPRE